MYALLGEGFTFVQEEDRGDTFVSKGARVSLSDYPFVKKGYEEREVCLSLIGEADAAIIGFASDDWMIKRLKNGKLTFRYLERLYRDGLGWRRYLRARIGTYLHHGRFQSYPLYMLCASGYNAGDCARFRHYKEKTFKWGYFPLMRTYDPSTLMAQKTTEPVDILWAGRLLFFKRPLDGVAVIERLAKEGYSFRFHVVGSGEEEENSRKQVKDASLEKCVRFYGEKSTAEVRDLMEKAAIFLFTSDYREGWGAVLNEAMNSGCAVVASVAAGAVPFLIQDGVNGFVYPSGDRDALYHHIKTLLENPKQRYDMGLAAYNTITSEWNGENAAKRLLELVRYLTVGEGDIPPSGPCSRAKPISQDQMYLAVKRNEL